MVSSLYVQLYNFKASSHAEFPFVFWRVDYACYCLRQDASAAIRSAGDNSYAVVV